MEELRYTIPGNPITKKNSQRIIRIRNRDGSFRSLIKPSPQYEAYEATALYFLQPVPDQPITGPVNCEYVYFMQTLRKVDATNLISATDDILVAAGILEDDNRDVVAGHDGTRVYYSKDEPRVEITITPMEDYPQWKESQEKAVEPSQRGKKKKTARARVKSLPADPDFDEEHWD